jgi:hypothetical protein
MLKAKTTTGLAAPTGLSGVELCGGAAVRPRSMHRDVFSESILAKKKKTIRIVILTIRGPSDRSAMHARSLGT